MPSHRFSSATGEQKGITQTIYTDSEPPNPMPKSIMPSAKLRSANLPFFYVSCCDAVGNQTPDALTTVLHGGGFINMGPNSPADMANI